MLGLLVKTTNIPKKTPSLMMMFFGTALLSIILLLIAQTLL